MKNNKLSNFFLILAILATIVYVGMACTDKVRARSFGGSTSVDLPAGQKLVMATWKESNLWYLTRPMREGETAETFEFSESSTFGVLQGTVTFVEHK